VLPFLLACVILFCNTATGINSVIGYNTDILLQSGLADLGAHWGYVVFTFFNFLFTIVGMTLVDRKGRKFLFLIGTSGIIVSLLSVGGLFVRSEAHRHDARDVLQSMIADDRLSFHFDEGSAQQLVPNGTFNAQRSSLSVIYSFGGFTATTTPVRTGDTGTASIEVNRAACVPAGKVEAFFRNPFANLDEARTAPLIIEHAYVSPVPNALNGWLVAICLYSFVAFYAMGPGVCVWLALSELMPTRIRSNGMSIALVINQLVSTTLAAIFLPVVGKYGYSTMFFLFCVFTVIYLIVVAVFLPETKGKTLEEIEKHFERV
jgi:SP family myo-inositol transporter-like MFS transporter 13